MPSRKKKEKIVVSVERTERKKNPPRTAYTKANPSPHAFREGVSGNPGGKPKHDRLLSRAGRAQLADRAPDKYCEALGLPSHSSIAQCIMARLIRESLRGEIAATRLLLEYTEGAPRQSFSFEDEDGDGQQTPYVNVVFVNAKPIDPSEPGASDLEARAASNPPRITQIERTLTLAKPTEAPAPTPPAPMPRPVQYADPRQDPNNKVWYRG